MRKTIDILLTLMLVLTLCACGNTESPDPTLEQTADPMAQSEELARDAFAQFGVNLDDIKPDIEGETASWIDVGNRVVTPITYGAMAQWVTVASSNVSQQQISRYLEKIYAAIKAVSDDGQVHGSKSEGEWDTIITEDNLTGTWGYQHDGVYVDVYKVVSSAQLGVELVYAG